MAHHPGMHVHSALLHTPTRLAVARAVATGRPVTEARTRLGPTPVQHRTTQYAARAPELTSEGVADALAQREALMARTSRRADALRVRAGRPADAARFARRPPPPLREGDITGADHDAVITRGGAPLALHHRSSVGVAVQRAARRARDTAAHTHDAAAAAWLGGGTASGALAASARSPSETDALLQHAAAQQDANARNAGLAAGPAEGRATWTPADATQHATPLPTAAPAHTPARRPTRARPSPASSWKRAFAGRA